MSLSFKVEVCWPLKAFSQHFTSPHLRFLNTERICCSRTKTMNGYGRKAWKLWTTMVGITRISFLSCYQHLHKKSQFMSEPKPWTVMSGTPEKYKWSWTGLGDPWTGFCDLWLGCFGSRIEPNSKGFSKDQPNNVFVSSAEQYFERFSHAFEG